MKAAFSNVEGKLTAAEALCALYAASRAHGMGMLHASPGPLSLADAETRLALSRYVDYFNGRPIKTDFSNLAAIDLRLFDRDAGSGAGVDALEQAIASKAKAESRPC